MAAATATSAFFSVLFKMQPASCSSTTVLIDSDGVVRRRIRANHHHHHMNSNSPTSRAAVNSTSPRLANRQCSSDVEKNMSSDELLTSVNGITNLRSLVISDGNYVAHASGATIVIEPEISSLNTSCCKTFILNSTRRCITSLCCSEDGRYLATGESGHNPKVRIFDFHTKIQVCELQSHRFSIECVKISPKNTNIVISIGSIHDTTLIVWNWRTKTRLSGNNICAEVFNVRFSEDASYFVTVGTRHVKFWYMPVARRTNNRSVTLRGRAAILGDHKQNTFKDVLCQQIDSGGGRVLVLSASGLLIEIDSERRIIERWVDVTTSNAHCLVKAGHFIVVGCMNGLIRVFNSDLTFVSNIPLPNPKYGIVEGTFPAVTSLAFSNRYQRLYAIYADHSTIVWDFVGVPLSDCERLRDCSSHCACVWTVGSLNDDHFISGSSDGSMRVWKMEDSELRCKRIIVPDNTPHQQPAAIRSICYCESLAHVSIGDASGNISVYSAATLPTPSSKIAILEAHENDVLSLSYSKRHDKADRIILASSGRDRVIHLLDASSGKYEPLGSISDHSGAIQCVHLITFPHKFNEYTLISSGADKAIVVRKCTFEPTPDDTLKITRVYQLCERQSLTDLVVDPLSYQLLAAYQDRLVRVYRLLTNSQRISKLQQFKGCMCVDGSLVKLRLLAARNEPAQPLGDLRQTSRDQSFTSVLATACSRKRVYLWKWTRSAASATHSLITIISGGHSDPVTDMRFVWDSGLHLITCSADSCIMVWKVPETSEINNSKLTSNERKKGWTKIEEEQATAATIVAANIQKNNRASLPAANRLNCSFLYPAAAAAQKADDQLSSTTWTRLDENVPPKTLRLKSLLNDLVNEERINHSNEIFDALIWAKRLIDDAIQESNGQLNDDDAHATNCNLIQKLNRLKIENSDIYNRAEKMIDAILGPLLDLASTHSKQPNNNNRKQM